MLEQLSYNHPRAYRHILTAGLWLMVLGGLFSWFQPVFARTQQRPPATHVVAVQETVAVKPSAQALPPNLPVSLSSYRPSDVAANPAELARSINSVWFGDQHWAALNQLWNHESGFNPGAKNPSSGACGIPQALPCSKITDHTTTGQIVWGLSYIQSRYGNPSNAWRFWQTHHWY